ncbi:MULTISPECIES: hypothetical protein [Psychrobacter]|uniref:hypothetical protein n=1 Tax=Psychrobacter TaxID=497 RepID=UPI0018DFE73A|nr:MULTISPECIES: hypothetical protein [Psychrobacter]MCG3871216.1 hypothetical protein [Psychrobacter sp. Ps7]
MSHSVLFNLPHNLVHGRLTGLHLDSAPSALAGLKQSSLGKMQWLDSWTQHRPSPKTVKR